MPAQVCLDCGQRDATATDECRSCGAVTLAELDGEVIVGLPKHATECFRCGTVELPLSFRRYRRVIGLLVVDLVRDRAGYFCRDCRRALFWQFQLSTLILGWWGVLAMLFRNPGAILTNFGTLFGPPGDARFRGALTVDALQVRDPEMTSGHA